MSRIWVPKFKILEGEQPAPVARVAGRYKLQVVTKGGIIKRETPWFDNLITNSGLDMMGATDALYLARIRVGTGSNTPAFTDTALQTLVASTSTIVSNSTTVNNSSPYEVTATVVKQFGAGVAAGNLTEVGIDRGSGNLFSRALIVDGGGSPTTFPVGVDEYLNVTYQLILYPPLSDATGTISITGVGSRDYTVRICNTPSDWGSNVGGGWIATLGQARLFTGTIAAVTSTPSGNIGTADSFSNDAYVSANYYRTGSAFFGLTQGNGAIRTATFGTTASNNGQNSRFQCEYSSSFTKTSSQVLTLGFKFSWARV